MAGLIPEDALREVRDRAPIVEVVGAHVGLRRVGRNHVGLCPFHAEKTPSFTVSEDRGIFHCFGCGAGGNVFTFLMKMESLTFPEVVERLAQRYGVVLPERGGDDPARGEREALYRLNEKTARYYQRYLWESQAAAPARAYLDERGISRATAERYLLGCAPAAGAALVRRLRDAKLGVEHAVKLGLVGERRGGGGHYDRFRGRLMFPITDSSGRVVGFGSRGIPGTASDQAGLPKYLNSPETPLYRKGSHCYGLAVARDAVRTRDRVLVVEGYFDVLALAEAGVGNVVASLGTALTTSQLHVLRRFTRNVVAFFDGDAAGQKAAEKSLAIFLEAGLWGHGAFLPAGDDPDTFVRREGAAAVEDLIGRAVPLLDFYLDRVLRMNASLAERVKVAPQIAQLLRLVTDPMEYDLTVRRTADRLDMDEALLRKTTRAAAPGPGSAAASPHASARRPDVAVRPGKPDATDVAQQLLVTAMLHDPAVAARDDVADAVAAFPDPAWRSAAESVVAAARAGAPPDAALVLANLDPERGGRLTDRLVRDVDEAVTAREIADSITWLRAEEERRRRPQLVREIREAEAVGDAATVTERAAELRRLRQEEHP